MPRRINVDELIAITFGKEVWILATARKSAKKMHTLMKDSIITGMPAYLPISCNSKVLLYTAKRVNNDTLLYIEDCNGTTAYVVKEKQHEVDVY